MDFLNEVTSSTEKVEKDEINSLVPKIAESVIKCKDEINCFLDSVYVKYTKYPEHNNILSGKIKATHESVNNVRNNLLDITKKDFPESKNAVVEHEKALEDSNAMIKIVKALMEIHENLIDIRELQNGPYVKCMEKIKNLDEVIATMPQEIEVISDLKRAIFTEKQSLLNKLTTIFNDNIISKSNDNKAFLKVNEKHELSEVMQALFLYKTSITPLDKITRFLWENIFVPIVTLTVELKIVKEGDLNVLEIMQISDSPPDYSQVFLRIELVLEFLENLQIKLSDDVTVLSYIGRDIRDNLSELLIKNCLQKTIPTTNEGLENYKNVIEATNNLETKLLKAEFFTEDTASILEYANNIDIHFINKKCQDYLQKAEYFMKKDLHDLVEIGEPYDPTKPLEHIDNFPRSSISGSVVDLLDLVEEILGQSLIATDVCAGRLLYTVQSVFVKYATFIPEYHQKLLKTIPQQVAVFYNNCCYIDYKLVKLNENYSKKLQSVVKVGFGGFKDEGRHLVKIGKEMFDAYVQSQIKQIHEIMKESGLQSQPTLDKLEPNVEKCLRQCLRQQELLKTVWHKVLPYQIYNETIGTILNTLCNYLINSTTKLEDISSNATEQLVDCIKIITTRGPKLFTDPKEINLFVSSWYKLNELIFVLNGRLLDINDRWADGKGPLALQFTPEELRQLIRALFQNTEMRANLLAKIHG